ncbi:superkiller complex protein 2-like [Artemia franciscana]|uniref:Helicase SKI2W n=1 Tax=Artemia franciscana TaxID=6661 RepID=A0AA88KWZ4_ARTSF|nr:hypothetical protein QYM36_017378 [Artemia franciscana]
MNMQSTFFDSLRFSNQWQRHEETTTEGKRNPTLWAETVNVSEAVDFDTMVPNPAFKWKFELDSFQKHAILKLEKGESVLIAAHTSAGKTVVAEYAIALSRKHKMKTFYTSPIKALSNQKFREFRSTSEDVGIITGDVQINPNASCVIMTTEILRSMLYNGQSSVQDLEWVIFDEVHYMNDSERGVVYEEVLILLPEHVGIIMLSATVPNTLEFASWVGMTKKRKIYVISTPKRPVPLEHYLYTGQSRKSQEHKFLILGAEGTLLRKGYLDAVEAKKPKEKFHSQQKDTGKGALGGGRRNYDHRCNKKEDNKVKTPQRQKQLWIRLIDHLRSEDKLPVICFTLSRDECDENADLLASVDLTTADEKEEISRFWQKCLKKLKGSDKKLPQVTEMSSLLNRGIGVHHSGKLPILKEIVEMLFQAGKVKLLFATETFAMGVNMPARSVVFDDIMKYDDNGRRQLLPSEYIQMAGRAGRRGLDSTGTVLILCKDNVPELESLHKMMLGKPQKLESQFRVTYSMILNLLRGKQLKVQDMMKLSFSEVHFRSKIEQLEKEMKQLEIRPKLDCNTCSDVESLYEAARKYLEKKAEAYKLVLHPQVIKALKPGRFLTVVDDECVLKVGLLLDVNNLSKEPIFKTLVLRGSRETKRENSMKKIDKTRPKSALTPKMVALVKHTYFVPHGRDGDVLSLKVEDIADVTNFTLKVNCKAILNDWNTKPKEDSPCSEFVKAVDALLSMSKDPNFSSLNLEEHLKQKNYDMVLKLQDLQKIKPKYEDFNCYLCSSFYDHWNFTVQEREEYKRLAYLTSDERLGNSAEYAAKLNVLKSFEYVNSDNVVQLKGQVACSIGKQELMLTELLFHNIFTDLPEEDIAALLSCLVFNQKPTSSQKEMASKMEPNLTPSQKEIIERIQKLATDIGETQKRFGLLENVNDYVDQFQFGLVEVVYRWAMGESFREIIELTDEKEGSIVRVIQQLVETLEDIRKAAQILGNPTLESKMEAASTKIKRDIVFQGSLYLE